VATGAAGVADFLETTGLETLAVELIILVAVEVFMAGIRTLLDTLHSIFEPTFKIYLHQKFFEYLINQ
jgi:hypothetical protein